MIRPVTIFLMMKRNRFDVIKLVGQEGSSHNGLIIRILCDNWVIKSHSKSLSYKVGPPVTNYKWGYNPIQNPFKWGYIPIKNG